MHDASAAFMRHYRLVASSLWHDSKCISVDELARAHFGLQAQDATAVLLSMFNRMRCECCASSRTRTALTERYLATTNKVVRAWGQRCTLHMYAREHWPIAMAASRARLEAATASSVARTNAASPVTEAQQLIEAELLAGREVDTSAVDAICEGENASIGLVTRRHAFLRATTLGLGSRVTRDGRRLTLAPRCNDFGWDPPSLDEAMLTIARTYFKTYAPATENDFRYWMGALAGDSKLAFRTLCDEGYLQRVRGDAFVTSNAAETLGAEPPPRVDWPVRLLGRFDPYLLAHRRKTWLIREELRSRVWTRNADILPTVIVHGRIRGVWKWIRNSNTAAVTLFPSDSDVDTPFTDGEIAAIRTEAHRIATQFWEATDCVVTIEHEVVNAEQTVEKDEEKRGDEKRRRKRAKK